MHRKIQRSGVIALMFFAVILTAGCSGDNTQETTGLQPVKTEDTDQEKADDSGSADQEGDGDTSGEPESVFVHICGEVACPGVYELPAGSRLYEAIEAAGGLTDSAAADVMNQASVVEDGQQVYVFSQEEVQTGTGPEGTSPGVVSPEMQGQGTQDDKVNLNTATMEELMTLSGVGEAKAAAIIRYREENGSFQSIEELMEVEGIKEGVFHKVKEQIKV